MKKYFLVELKGTLVTLIAASICVSAVVTTTVRTVVGMHWCLVPK